MSQYTKTLLVWVPVLAILLVMVKIRPDAFTIACAAFVGGIGLMRIIRAGWKEMSGK